MSVGVLREAEDEGRDDADQPPGAAEIRELPDAREVDHLRELDLSNKV